MKRTLLITMMTGLCTLALTASCDDSSKKKIAEQQATIDSLQRVQEGAALGQVRQLFDFVDQPQHAVRAVGGRGLGQVPHQAVLIPGQGLDGVKQGVGGHVFLEQHVAQSPLPEGFGVVRSERLDITVRDIGDTVKVSEQVIDFCARQGVDSRRAFFAGLCLEEMAGNVVLHGFPKDDKKHSLDIRVSHKGDDVILRLRDNCIAFNPAEQVQADGIKNVGIRLACGIAKEFQYQNILGLNVLMMKI